MVRSLVGGICSDNLFFRGFSHFPRINILIALTRFTSFFKDKYKPDYQLSLCSLFKNIFLQGESLSWIFSVGFSRWQMGNTRMTMNFSKTALNCWHLTEVTSIIFKDIDKYLAKRFVSFVKWRQRGAPHLPLCNASSLQTTTLRLPRSSRIMSLKTVTLWLVIYPGLLPRMISCRSSLYLGV